MTWKLHHIVGTVLYLGFWIWLFVFGAYPIGH